MSSPARNATLEQEQEWEDIIAVLADEDKVDYSERSEAEHRSDTDSEDELVGSDTERERGKGRPRRQGLRPAIAEESYGDKTKCGGRKGQIYMA